MKKKHTLRTGLSLLLVLCMMLGVCPLTAFAEGEKPELNYVSLGASNVNGYGLRGYLKPTGTYTDDDTVMEAAALDNSLKAGANVLGYDQAPAGSYPALLQEELEKQGYTVNLSQLAISSMRAEELRILLDNGYNGDAYSAWRFIGEGGWFDIADGTSNGDFSQLCREYQDAVANADLITVDIGANNFGVYLSYMLTDNFSLDNDLTNVDAQIGKLYNDAKAQVNALFAKYGISMTDYEELADTLVYALVGFCYNFDKSMERIYELNPDATVVVVSIQNLMAGLGGKLGNVEVPLGDIIGALINTANTYIAIGSPYSSKYLCADVRQNGRVEFFIDKMAAYDGNPENLDENIIDCFDVWDGSPGEEYDKGFHVKYQLAKLAIQNNESIVQENVATYLNDGEGKALLDRAYDAYAQIMSTAAKYDTLDLSALTVNSNPIETALTTAIWDAVKTAVSTEGTTEGTYTLPDNFFSDIANSCNVSESVVKTVAAMAVRTDIGNSFFGHPTPDGHRTVANAILAALENKTTGEDVIKNEIEIASEQLYRFAYDHGAESLVKVVDFVAGKGYITAEQAEILKTQIGLADTAIKDGDKQAILDSCEKLAEMLYEYACDNGYVPEEVQEAIAKAIGLYDKLKDKTPEELKAYVEEQLEALTEKYHNLIDDATHGEYVPNSESYYVALGGDTVYGTGIGRDDNGYFDLLLGELELDKNTQYQNLGKENLDLTKLLAYIEENAAEIEKADLITYQADAAAFILAALNDEEPDWSNYLTDEQIALVEKVLSEIRTVPEKAWTEYAESGAAMIGEKIESAVAYITEAYSSQDENLAALLNDCAELVRPYVEQYAEKLLEVLPSCEDAESALETAETKTKEVLESLEPFETYIEKVLFASVAYAVDTVKAVDAIQEINPDAVLIVVGMYNPLDGLEVVVNGETVDVGAYLDYLIEATNVYYTALAVADGGFTFVAVPDATINGFEDAIDVSNPEISTLGTNLLELKNSMYADADGHKYIYDQIMAALDTTVTAKTLTGISVKTAPNKTSYTAGENFDPAGMVIEAKYNDESTEVVTGWIVTDGSNLAVGKTSVTISYTENDVTKTTTQAITVANSSVTPVYPSVVPSTPAVTVPVSDDENSIKVAVTVSGNTVTVKEISSSEISKLGTNVVSMDFSGLNRAVNEVKLPTKSVEAIAESASSGLEIKLSTGTVAFDAAALKAISEAAAGKDIALNVETVDKKELTYAQKSTVEGLGNAVILKATLTSGGKTISDFGGGNATVTVPYAKKDAKAFVVIYYLDDSGKLTKMKATYNAVTKSVTFVAPHFSEYVLTEVTELPFVDVDESAYYAEAVRWAAANGITVGVDDTHFAPLGIATRSQMVTFLWRAAGCPEPTATTCEFTDVKADEYYYKAVLWAVETGITVGTSDTTFSPLENVSRSETVTFLARLNGVKDDAAGYSHSFADVKETDYYNNAVAWAATNGITLGTGADTFSPNDDCLRSQIVTFLYRNFVK